MYFQACSNSEYPQHSGERFRTNGPLVNALVMVKSWINYSYNKIGLMQLSPMGRYNGKYQA